MLRELSIVRGWPETVETFREWRRRPVMVVLPWLGFSLCIAATLLLLVWIVGEVSPPSPERPKSLPTDAGGAPANEHMGQLFRNNLLVLALHAMACFAGYVVHVALNEPDDGSRLSRATRSLAVTAVLFVPIATLLSIVTQAWVLGSYASTAAHHLQVAVGALLRTTLAHSVVELTAVFLPLAAWLVVRVRGGGGQLLAATIVSTVIAVPMLAFAAHTEAHGWTPRVIALRWERSPLRGRELAQFAIDPSDHGSATLTVTVGDPITRKPVAVLADAQQAATTATRDPADGAAAIVSSQQGFVVLRALVQYEPGQCERDRARAWPRIPWDLTKLGTARIHAGRSDRSIDVLFFVQGNLRFTRESLTVDVPRTSKPCVQ